MEYFFITPTSGRKKTDLINSQTLQIDFISRRVQRDLYSAPDFSFMEKKKKKKTPTNMKGNLSPRAVSLNLAVPDV